MTEPRWSRLLSREFLLPLVIIVFSGVAMLQGLCTFVEFSAASVGVSTGYGITKAVKDIKTAKKE